MKYYETNCCMGDDYTYTQWKLLQNACQTEYYN